MVAAIKNPIAFESELLKEKLERNRSEIYLYAQEARMNDPINDKSSEITTQKPLFHASRRKNKITKIMIKSTQLPCSAGIVSILYFV